MGSFKGFILFQLLLVMTLLTGCGDDLRPTKSLETDTGQSPDPPEKNDEIEKEEEFRLSICSDLSFGGVTWPENMTDDEKNAFALSLNITGSFEGAEGWSNLTNNFDGQGLSMGLFNQTLGTGSLQPLWEKLRVQSPEVFEKYFDAKQRESLFAMLDNWKGLSLLEASVSGRNELNALNDFSPVEKVPLPSLQNENPKATTLGFDSNYDSVDKFYTTSLQVQMSKSNTASVTWALINIYSDSQGRNFRPEWKLALKKLANDPEYVSIQMKAAERIHIKAKRYQVDLELFNLTSYLVLMDFVVQNGGLYQRNIEEYLGFAADNPNLPFIDKILRLIEIRVKESKPRWQEDVRKRKQTLAHGIGTVHGRKRNLHQEYCY